jgi:ribosomal protein L40E
MEKAPPIGAEGQVKGPICARCTVAIPPKAARCPTCGTLTPRTKAMPIFAGICGILALAFIVLVMWYSARESEDPVPEAPAPTQSSKPLLGS